MLGVYLGSWAKPWGADDPSILLAALFGTTLAPIAGRFGWHWGIERGFKEAHQGASIRIPAFFGVIMKWICPVFLLVIFTLTVLTSLFGFDLSTFSFGSASSYVLDLIGGVKDGTPVPTNQAAQMSVALVLIVFFFFGLLSARSKAYKRAEQGLPKHD
jgi:hypothetical protein